MPRANNYLLESFQDFLIELDMNLVEILIFSKKVPTFLSALLIILVGLMVTLFSEKIHISTRLNMVSCSTGLKNLERTLVHMYHYLHIVQHNLLLQEGLLLHTAYVTIHILRPVHCSVGP